MSEIKLQADSGSGTTSIKGPSSTTGNAAREFLLPDVANGTLRTTTTPGAILQVVQTVKTDTFSYTGSTAYTDITGLSVSITPTSASNKILVMLFVTVGQGNIPGIRLMRDSTAIGIGDASGSRLRCTALIRSSGDSNTSGTGTPVFLDSPSATSQITYKAQLSLEGSGHTAYINRSPNDLDSLTGSRSMSSITAMEIAG